MGHKNIGDAGFCRKKHL